MGKLQSELQYRNDYALNMAQFQSHLNQPGFLHAKRSQQLASSVNYRQPLHQYTCDPEQLNVKHAKQAYQLQSDVSVAERHAPFLGWVPSVQSPLQTLPVSKITLKELHSAC